MNRSILLSFALLTSAVSAQQQVPVCSGCSGSTQQLLADPRPEPEWDITGYLVAETGDAIIVRVDDAGDPRRAAEIATLAKDVYNEIAIDENGTLRTTTGVLGAALTSGALAAVEIDAFDETWDPSYDPTPEPLAGETIGSRLELVTADGTGRHVAFLYLYDASQYAARMAALGAGERTLWSGDLVQTDGTGAKSLYVSGQHNVFAGRVSSGGGLKIGGTDHSFLAPVSWDGGLLQLTANGTTFAYMPVEKVASAMTLAPAPLSAYQQHPAALLFTGDVTVLDGGGGALAVSDGFQTWPAEGKVIVTGGSIDVEGIGLSGRVTLVAGGEINLSANSSLLQPAVDGLLAWTSGGIGDVTIGGSGNVLSGALIATAQLVRFNGSDNELTGKVRGGGVRFLGSGNQLSDGVW